MRPRDITRSVLSRPLRSPFAPSGGDPTRGRWLWVAGVVWLLWVTLISDHSFLRIAQLRRELGTARQQMSQLSEQAAAVEAEFRDPQARREQAERVLRLEQGWSRPGEIVYRFDEAVRDSSRR